MSGLRRALLAWERALLSRVTDCLDLPGLIRPDHLLIPLAHRLPVVVDHQKVLMIRIVHWLRRLYSREELLSDLLGLFEVGVGFLDGIDTDCTRVLLK